MDHIFIELSIVIAIGAVVALIMRLIRQPLIIGHILTGVIAGPIFLNQVKNPDTFEVFAQFGVALLLFLIGLGLNPQVIREVGRAAGLIGTVQILLTVYIGACAAALLGFTRTESMVAGFALAFSSTIIILKLLSDKKEQTRLYGKLTIGILLVQDIVATLALLFVTSSKGGSFSVAKLGDLGIKGVGIGAVLWLVTTKVLPKLTKFIASNQEFLFLFAIGWGFGVAALFKQIGFSLEVGALIAGVALASQSYSQEISSRLRPLRDFFVVVFFIELGTWLNFNQIGKLLVPLAVFISIVIWIKPIIVLVSLGLMGYTKQTSFKAAGTMAQISEFSIVFVIIAANSKLISTDLVSITTILALISIAVSTYSMIYSDGLYKFFERYLKLFERRKTNFEQRQVNHYDIVLFGYHKGGNEFLKVFKTISKRFVVVDYDPDVIDLLEEQKIHYLYGDATDIEFLEEVCLDKAKLVVSTVTDHATNKFLVQYIESINPKAVIICHSDTPSEAAELYELGASYVMMPHYIGSEKIGAFIKRNGYNKTEFKKFREKHLAHLQAQLGAGM